MNNLDHGIQWMIEQLQTANWNANEKITDLNKENESMRKTIDELSTLINNKVQEIVQLKNRVRELEEKLFDEQIDSIDKDIKHIQFMSRWELDGYKPRHMKKD